MHATNQIQNTTQNAGFAPAPAEAHPEAVGRCARIVDDELEICVSTLERTWTCQPNRAEGANHVQ